MPSSLRPKVVLFDFYRTLLDIWTDEEDPELWERLTRFLTYRGGEPHAERLRERYFGLVRRDLEASAEAHPEVDLPAVFGHLLEESNVPAGEVDPRELALLFRVLSVQQFRLFPDVLEGLKRLNRSFRLGLVTDAQRVFLDPELRMSGIRHFFDAVVVSSDVGYRKPDRRMLTKALEMLGVSADEAVYVGDAPVRDMRAAHAAGVTAIYLNRDGQAPSRDDAERPDLTVADLYELCARLGTDRR